jgi:hypothetical protein
MDKGLVREKRYVWVYPKTGEIFGPTDEAYIKVMKMLEWVDE